MKNKLILTIAAIVILAFVLAPKSTLSLTETLMLQTPASGRKFALAVSPSQNSPMCIETIGNKLGSCSCTGNVECKKAENSITCKTKANGVCYEKYCMLIPNGTCKCITTRLGADCTLGGSPVSSSLQSPQILTLK